MLAKILIIFALVIVFALIYGAYLLISGKSRPFADEAGVPQELSKKDKYTVGILALAIVITLLSLVLTSDNEWIVKLKRKINKH